MHTNGKGSKSRISDRTRFNTNYDEINWSKPKPVDNIEPPPDWWTYHHEDCGTVYRGCHPSLCPKDQYEQTGIWRKVINRRSNVS